MLWMMLRMMLGMMLGMAGTGVHLSPKGTCLSGNTPYLGVARPPGGWKTNQEGSSSEQDLWCLFYATEGGRDCRPTPLYKNMQA